MNFLNNCKKIGTGILITSVIVVGSNTNFNFSQTDTVNNSTVNVGQPAQAGKARVVYKTFKFGWNWVKIGFTTLTTGLTFLEAKDVLDGLNSAGVTDDLIVFADKAKISWNEASDICNRQGGYLQWVQGLKTCRQR